MSRRWQGLVAAGILAGAAIGIVLALRSDNREARLAPLRAAVESDLKDFLNRRYARPVLLGTAEDGCAAEQFRACLKDVADEDIVYVADLEAFIAVPPGQDDQETVKKLRWTAHTILERKSRLRDGLLRAARQSTGNVARMPADGGAAETFLGLSPRFALLVLLADARLAAETGGFPAALDRCTAAIALSQDLGRGGLFQQAFSSMILQNLALKGLAFTIDIGRPDERQLAEIRRRLDVLMHHAPKFTEPFENDLLWWRQQKLLEAEIRDSTDKKMLPIQDLAVDALQKYEEILQRYRSISGSTYKERRDALREIDRRHAESSNPFVRQFTFELDAFEQQMLGLLAEQRILMVLCEWEIDRLKNPSAPPEIVPMQDPFDGQPLRGFVENGRLVVYSVGPNLIDDRGSRQDLIMEIHR